jgi:ketosteroid isomerase-like protein
MKRNIFVAALLIFFVGCSPQQSDQLNQQQKDQITNEVKAVVDSALARMQRLDGDGALQYYSPEMVAVGDSSIIDFQAYKKGWTDLPKSVATMKWTTTQCQCMVLTKDLAYSSLFGKAEMLMKSGDKITVDPQIYTSIFKRVGNQWKIIYEHGSGVPVIQKAGKK